MGRENYKRDCEEEMTDADKLKRLAEAVDLDHASGIYMDGELVKYRDTILALIAENERLKEYGELMQTSYVLAASERDEAVALLRKIEKSKPMRIYDGTTKRSVSLDVFDRKLVKSLLARIDAAE